MSLASFYCQTMVLIAIVKEQKWVTIDKNSTNRGKS